MAQLTKVAFDLAAWRIEQATRERVLTRQTWAIFVSAFGIVIDAFDARFTALDAHLHRMMGEINDGFERVLDRMSHIRADTDDTRGPRRAPEY